MLLGKHESMMRVTSSRSALSERQFHWMFCILWVLALTSLPCWADLQAQASLSTREAGVGEPVTLTVQVQTDEKPADLPWPTIKGLEPFTVQKTSGTSNSSSTTIINGQISSQTFYIVSYTFTLTAQKPGTYPIGPIRYTHKNFDRDLGSATITIQKTEASLSILPSVNKRKVFVGEQVVYTLRIVPQSNVQSINLTQDLQKLLGNRFYFQRLETKVEPHTVTMNGQPTKVYDLHISLFPLLSGTAKLEGIPVQYQQVARSQQRRRTGSMFDMFEDEFFGGARLVTMEAISSPLQIEALSLPTPAPAGFSGSVGDYTVAADLDRVECPTGEATTLTIVIRGNGQPKSIGKPELPDLSAFEVFNPEEQSATQIREGQIWSTKTYKYVLVPKRKGQFELGAIGYTYFQPNKESYLSAKSPSLSLTVVQGKEAEVPEGRPMSQQEVAELGSDIRHIQTGTSLEREDDFLYRTLGYWAMWCLSPLAFAGALVIRSRKRLLETDAGLKRRSEASAQMRKRLREADQASSKKDAKGFYRELALALQGFVSDRLNVEFRGMVLDEAKQRLEKAGLSAEGLAAWTQLHQECDFGQFAGLGRDADSMQKARQNAEQLLRRLDKEVR
jgi:hypothetical protein